MPNVVDPDSNYTAHVCEVITNSKEVPTQRADEYNLGEPSLEP